MAHPCLPCHRCTPVFGKVHDAHHESLILSSGWWFGTFLFSIIEGSLEVKLPTIWTDEEQSRAEAERRGRLEERRSEEKE